MFVIRGKYFKARATFGWWPKDLAEVTPLLDEAPVVVLTQCPQPLAQALKRWVFKIHPFQTPLVDLTKTEEELWQQLEPKSCRYEVRKGQKLECEILMNRETETARLLLNESIRRLKYRGEVSAREFQAALHVHDIFLCRWQGAAVAAHVILHHAPLRARLLMSGTVDRHDERFRAVVGPCNRLLHWHEFLHYKSRGFQRYDFGGCELNKESPDYPVSQFKLSFGGEVVSEPTLFLAKRAAVRAVFRGLRAGQSAVRKVPWPEAWLQAVRVRPRLQALFR